MMFFLAGHFSPTEVVNIFKRIKSDGLLVEMHKPVGVQVNYCCMSLPVFPLCISIVTKTMPKKANITQTAINSDFVFVQSPVSEAPDIFESNQNAVFPSPSANFFPCHLT